MKVILAALLALVPCGTIAAGLVVEDATNPTAEEAPPAIYPTFGVHNPPQYSPCGPKSRDCLNRRTEGEPSDPLLPQQWVSDWTMYRVFNNWQDNPPPYTSPPSTLDPSDYATSSGWTAYDNTYQWDSYPDSGAMMEYYQDYCLPIFPIDNNFTCAFISLGLTAYFLTFDENRPEGMPECCLFSPVNHPPRRDFVKHLPFSEADTARIDGIQAYSLSFGGSSSEPPVLFGYAFNSAYETDSGLPRQQAYRHPYAFYFSGSDEPGKPPNAPIVQQSYTNFSARSPDPAVTWDLVGKMCTASPLPKCMLFPE